jgi:hypothetical protein
MSESRRSHSAWPRVSDYVVETETDFELFQGQIREVPHAGPLHGTQLSQVNFVLGAYVATPVTGHPFPCAPCSTRTQSTTPWRALWSARDIPSLVAYGNTERLS